MKQKVSFPPLLRSVPYVLPSNAVLTDPPRPLLRRAGVAQCVELGLDCTVLPLVTATIEVSEQIRVRLMGAHRRIMDGDPSRVSDLFSGKGADGAKRLDHGHVYILPRANDAGRIDRVWILSPLRPFRRDEMDAIRGVRRLWQSDGRPDVRCVVTWQGPLDGPGARRPAKVFLSRTPFVPPRHWRKGRDLAEFVRGEVRRECLNHGVGAEPESVEFIDRMPPGLFDAIEYRRNRRDDPARPGYGLGLRFAHPVPGPFAVGYGAHFGLGLFESD